MKVSIVTLFPSLYDCFLQTSLIKHAQDKKLVTFDVAGLFSFVAPKERVDAPTCGPGPGMLIKPTVVQKAVEHQEATHGRALRVFFSPHGKTCNQQFLEKFAQRAREVGHVMLLPARYEGMDARVEKQYADEIVSMGDFVVMGGDVPAMLFIEGFLRLVPGIVGKKESVQEESFSGPFVDYPAYTHPIDWCGQAVPEIVRSGNHGAIEKWRQEQAVARTIEHHFDWLRSQNLTNEQKKLTHNTIPPHYVVLSHSDVMVGSERRKGTTSVTSIDIHDIARACATYGIKKYFIVTPLKDQQRVVNTLLDFWQKGVGQEYNRIRYQAVKNVSVVSSMQEVYDYIENQEGTQPIMVTTSARKEGHCNQITFHDQSVVWKHKKPVLLVFGTGQGLAPDLIEKSNYLLVPVEGLTAFNHLSVRSATAVVLDRWLGLNSTIAPARCQ